MKEKMLAFAHGSYVPATSPGPQRIEYSITGSTGTPLPSDLKPLVVETGTGALHAAPNPCDVVHEAASVIEKVALLPTTDAGNALVDELLSKHTKGLAVRKPLERRLKK
ncbi:MAG: hypothetical protein CMN30_27235 [Sandaracinus sp.]|nr:hypothetical protein [Sandaracinus sp.]|tara:strand:- start:3169 stop:3495 length:327 start_codon:yes stop_codon:yes gene_type:complete